MKPPSHRTALADALAAAYLEGGEWTATALGARSRAVLAPAPRWLAAVARGSSPRTRGRHRTGRAS